MASMKRLVCAIACLVLLSSCEPMPVETKQVIADWRAGKPDPDCEIPGHSSQWQADYCMAAMQTDDIIAAEPCMEHERHRRLGEECAARRHYKQDWCRLVARNDGTGPTFARCIADPEASGMTVKGGGLE